MILILLILRIVEFRYAKPVVRDCLSHATILVVSLLCHKSIPASERSRRESFSGKSLSRMFCNCVRFGVILLVLILRRSMLDVRRSIFQLLLWAAEGKRRIDR